MPNAVLERLAHEREQVHEMVDSILAGAEADERDPTESERELLTRHRGRLAELEVQIAELADVAEQVASARDVGALIARDRAPQPVAAAPAEQGGEVIYRTFGQFARDELISRYDLIANAAGGDEARQAARQRLARSEELRRVVANTLTSDIPGLVPPQHLAQITDVIDRSRPIVSNSRNVALTSGKLTYPKIAQRPVVGKQTAEKTELPSQKMIVNMVEVLAETYGGSGDISWQSLNWSTPDALGLLFDLFAEAYAITTETAAGTELGTNTNADVELATDDYPGWRAAIIAAAGAVYAGSKRYADVVYASPALGFHLQSFVSNLTPVSGAPGFGLPIVPSVGLAGNVCLVGNSQTLLCAETSGAPVEMRAVEPSIGGMEVGVIGAFRAELVDPKGFCEIVNAVP